ncbi:MAG: GNAT family N-acetyltransferase [Devosiaceae bacterium]|nr:GNAT family N-acetyltransferase [Devosiaceae bacterium MH13]
MSDTETKTQTSVTLRPYELTDADRLAVLLNDPDVTEMTSSIPYPYARSDAEAFLSNVRNEEGREVSRAILLEGELVGGVGFKARASDDEELGYWVGKPYWGRGITSVAVAAFIVELDRLGIEGPIHAQTVASNIPSQRVLLKNGFRFVGDGECITPARSTAKKASKRFVLDR